MLLTAEQWIYSMKAIFLLTRCRSSATCIFLLFFYREAYVRLSPSFSRLQRSRLTTSLDLQWDPANKWDFLYKECLPYVDVFLPNEQEILLLAAEKNLDKAQKKIGEYAPLIITKRGKKGAVAYASGQITHAAPFLHSKFVDAIGAGDSFNAGFISKYLKNNTLEECLRFGNLAGAINTTAAGGTSGFQNWNAFEKKVKDLFNIQIQK